MIDTKSRPRPTPAAPPVADPSTSPGRRLLAAQVLAFVALVAGLLGALGPAEHLRTAYSWPPATLPTGDPESTWYTPLLLAQHRPETLSARIPCAPPPALPAASRPVTVVGTARYPARVGALAVIRRAGEITVTVGGTTLARGRLEPDARRACAYELSFGDGRWSLRGGPDGVDRNGAIAAPPTVDGLFSGLDLRATGAPSVELTTKPYGATTTLRQALASTIAVLAIALALLLVSTGRGARRLGTVVVRLLRDGWAHARPVDAAVAIALVGWWIIAPAAFDDGWIVATEQAYASSHGFSDYYATLGIHFPLGFWLQWLHHWLVEATSALVFLRIPALLCLAGMWVLCRWMVARMTASAAGGADGVVLWALASAFVIGATAWGMTLRSEPAVALLVTGIAACMVRFLERSTAGSVAFAAVLTPFALTAHPAGAVALAPIAVASPRLFRWARAHTGAATTIVATTIALLAVVFFAGSDIEQRVLDIQTTRTFARESPGELSRYQFLSDEPYGTPVRRTAVALLVLAVFGSILRRRWSRPTLLDFPAAALGAGLLLLFLTPSKFPWHFGALIGLGAVAMAAETARIRAEEARATRWHVWPFLAIAAATAVAYWSWRTRWPWNPLDLVSLDWRPRFEDGLSLSWLAALPTLLLALAVLLAFVRGRRGALPATPWGVASLTAVVLTVPPLTFAVAMFVADGVKTASWTPVRQNVGSIAGDPGCGLADEVVVPVPGSARTVRGSLARPTAAWVPPPPVDGLPRYALAPTRGENSSPWLALPDDRPVGLFVAGTGSDHRLRVDWGRGGAGGVSRMGASELDGPLSRPAGNSAWRFLANGDLARPPGATIARVTAVGDARALGAVAVTAPVTYSTRPLARELAAVGAPSLVYPELLTYFPCARLPALRDGVVEVPRYVVVADYPGAPLRYTATSPFVGLFDLYEVGPLPLTDSKRAPGRVLVYGVDRRVPGSGLVPPTRSTVVS